MEGRRGKQKTTTMIEDIPLIIPVFNQPTYLRNLITWFKFYYPHNPVFVVDNASTSDEVNLVTNSFHSIYPDVCYFPFEENDCAKNLRSIIDIMNNEYPSDHSDYYIISDPDIMPHPNTPPKFLEEFKRWIDAGYHRAGFGLITDDLPHYLNNREEIIFNEKQLLVGTSLERNEYGFECYRAPLDTTFCMYSSKNGGWYSPMSGEDWSRSIRVFNAFHLPWYLDKNNLNKEMTEYFSTCRRFVQGQPSAGFNNHNPLA